MRSLRLSRAQILVTSLTARLVEPGKFPKHLMMIVRTCRIAFHIVNNHMNHTQTHLLHTHTHHHAEIHCVSSATHYNYPPPSRSLTRLIPSIFFFWLPSSLALLSWCALSSFTVLFFKSSSPHSRVAPFSGTPHAHARNNLPQESVDEGGAQLSAQLPERTSRTPKVCTHFITLLLIYLACVFFDCFFPVHSCSSLFDIIIAFVSHLIDFLLLL